MTTKNCIRETHQPTPSGGRKAAAAVAIVSTTALLAVGPAWSDEPPAAPGPAASGLAYGELLKPRRATARGAAQAAVPYTPLKRLDDEGQVPEIEMFVGESRVFPAPGVARIAVGNGSLLTAAALDNREVILFANAAGTSSLFVWNADGRYQRVKINIVPGDTSRYAREIAAFLSTIPKAKASIVGANIIVEGDELSDADMAKIDALAKRYPQVMNFTNRVGWEQMVMLDVKVVEFPASTLSDMGFKWSSMGGAAVGAIWGPGRRGHGGPYQLDVATGEGNAPPIVSQDGGAVSVPRGLNVLSVINLGLNAQLNLLAQEGKATILAQPQLSTRSGSKADFLAGGEIPYSVVTPNGTHVQFKSYGIKLEITPQVDHRGVIRAVIKSEVSSVDRSMSTSAGPGLLSRQANTEFNLRAGETIVLAGLLQRDTSTEIDKVPLLGDIPVLGALFRSKRYQNKETELVVFVTPTLVSAQSPGMADRIGRANDRMAQRLGPAPYLSDPLQPGSTGEPPAQEAPRGATSAADLPAAASEPAGRRSEVDIGLYRQLPADTTVRSEPGDFAASVLHLGAGSAVKIGALPSRTLGATLWRHVEVGRVSGWVRAGDLEPLRRANDPARASPIATQDQSGRWAQAPVTADSSGAPVRREVTPRAGPESTPPQRFRVRLDKLPLRVSPDFNAGLVAELIEGDVVEAQPQVAQGPWTPVLYRSPAGRLSGWVATQWLEPMSAKQ